MKLVTICIKCQKGKFVKDELTNEKYCGQCGFMYSNEGISKKHKEINELVEQPYALQIRQQRKIRKGRCNKICEKYRPTKSAFGKGRYESGQVRCMTCMIYLSRFGCLDKNGNEVTPETVGLFCKCCGIQVRTKPHSRIYKDRLRSNNR